MNTVVLDFSHAYSHLSGAGRPLWLWVAVMCATATVFHNRLEPEAGGSLIISDQQSVHYIRCARYFQSARPKRARVCAACYVTIGTHLLHLLRKATV